MKSVLFACCLLLALAEFTKAQPTMLEDLFQKCIKELGMTMPQVQAILKDPKVAKDNEKCFFKCTMEKAGHFRNGAFDGEAAKKNLLNTPMFKDRKAELEKMINDCKNEKGKDDCDTGFKVAMCLRDRDFMQ